MRLIKLRAISVATSLALLAGASSIGQLARAEAGGPTTVLASTSGATTNAALIPVTINFSEPVSGFTASDISVTNAAVMNFSGASASYFFELDPTADGTVTAQVAADVASSTSTSLGNQASNMLTFTADTTLPTITRTVTVGPTSATIDWTTNEPARGQVNYGLTSSYTASTTFEASASTTHSVTLSGLSASTTYHYEITAQDAAGNANTTGDLTFTTSAAAVAAPAISSVAVSAVGTSTATVTWDTNTAATGQVFYGTTTSYGSSTPLNAVASTTHSATISGLTPSTLYHFNVASTNAGGTSTSSDMTFTTSAVATTTPLAVTGVDAVNTIALPDGTYQNGFRWVIHFTVPDSETSFAMKFNDFTSSTGTIPVAGNLRYSSPQSSNASTTATGVVETNNDYGTALTLTGDASATTPGRQIDVTVELKVPVGTPTGVYSTLFGARSL